jgi:hypothetical protein
MDEPNRFVTDQEFRGALIVPSRAVVADAFGNDQNGEIAGMYDAGIAAPHVRIAVVRDTALPYGSDSFGELRYPTSTAVRILPSITATLRHGVRYGRDGCRPW